MKTYLTWDRQLVEDFSHGPGVFVSPHPDDLEISSGGTIARVISESHCEILQVVVTTGERSPRKEPITNEQMKTIRQGEAFAGAAFLGVQQTTFLQLSDLATRDTMHIAEERMCRILKETRPDHIFLPHPLLDGHRTHQLSAAVTMNSVKALLESVSNYTPCLWTYAVWGSFAYPNTLVDITSVIDVKREAIAKHSSQMADKNYAKAVICLNCFYGEMMSSHTLEKMDYAEAFKCFSGSSLKEVLRFYATENVLAVLHS